MLRKKSQEFDETDFDDIEEVKRKPGVKYSKKQKEIDDEYDDDEFVIIIFIVNFFLFLGVFNPRFSFNFFNIVKISLIEFLRFFS